MDFSKVIKGLAMMTPKKKVVLNRNKIGLNNKFLKCNRKVFSPNRINNSRNQHRIAEFNSTSPRKRTINIKDKIFKAQEQRRNLFSPQATMRNLQSPNKNLR